MTVLILWTLAIAVLTAIACALCGTFLVVKREAFVSEGLSHAVLPGILVAFLIFQDRGSPLLILSAALAGLVMVLLVQAICRAGLVDRDAALGIVFASLFSVGIILSSLHLRNVHFHAHCIIDGNLANAPLTEFHVAGMNLGPKSFVIMSATVVSLLLFIAAFFKELKLMVFDETLSRMLGFRPRILHTLWLALVSVTTVAAFETAGTILVVALMIAPPAAANLFTKRLGEMLVVSVVIAVASAILGVALALALDISHAGPIAFFAGMLFLGSAIVAPRRGFLTAAVKRRRQRAELFRQILIASLRDSGSQSREELFAGATWTRRQFQNALSACLSEGSVAAHGSRVQLQRS